MKGSYGFSLRGLKKQGRTLAVGGILQIVIEPILIVLLRHYICNKRNLIYFL
jgi:hypothetical protein